MVVAIDGEDFRRAGRLLATTPEPARMRYRLAARVRAAAQPILAEQRSRLGSIPSSGNHPGESLRDRVASSLTASVAFTRATAGVRIRAKETPTTRKFRQGPRRMNQRSWRHKTFGREPWVDQTADPGWFHEPALAGRDAFLAATLAELNQFATNLAVQTQAAVGGGR